MLDDVDAAGDSDVAARGVGVGAHLVGGFGEIFGLCLADSGEFDAQVHRKLESIVAGWMFTVAVTVGAGMRSFWRLATSRIAEEKHTACPAASPRRKEDMAETALIRVHPHVRGEQSS
ncbi:hypothetical protein [Nocardiopsis alba]|uniref:hypothetical protein n=1 Tax=Nocardiopsis alba TaxID=53437 RepID=UPI0035DAB0D5